MVSGHRRVPLVRVLKRPRKQRSVMTNAGELSLLSLVPPLPSSFFSLPLLLKDGVLLRPSTSRFSFTDTSSGEG